MKAAINDANRIAMMTHKQAPDGVVAAGRVQWSEMVVALYVDVFRCRLEAPLFDQVAVIH